MYSTFLSELQTAQKINVFIVLLFYIANIGNVGYISKYLYVKELLRIKY